MAQNHIAINASATAFAADMAQALRQIIGGRERLRFAKEKMDQMIVGGDYTMVQTNYGLPTAANATSLYNLVVGTLTHYDATAGANDANLQQLLSWFGLPA